MLFFVNLTICPESIIHHAQKLIFEKNFKSLTKTHSEINFPFIFTVPLPHIVRLLVVDSDLVIIFFIFH